MFRAKLVGTAKFNWNIVAPLIGICPWGAVRDTRAIMRGAPYASSHSAHAHKVASHHSTAGKSLNGSHSHFLLVDSGDHGGEWGSEIKIRTAIEIHTVAVNNSPVVQLVRSSCQHAQRTRRAARPHAHRTRHYSRVGISPSAKRPDYARSSRDVSSCVVTPP